MKVADKHDLLRSVLKRHPGGLTAADLSGFTDIKIRDVRRYMHDLPDAKLVGQTPGNRSQAAYLWAIDGTVELRRKAKRAKGTWVYPPIIPGKPHTVWVGGTPDWGAA